ncbi:MAG: hypothetical protein WAK20_11630 [Candidatus Acidiferrum sp.]
MTQSFTSLDALLLSIVFGTLAIGLPIVFVLLIRFLWDRNLNLGRSKELEKLIWQLHRIASAMEHQMNLSFPAVQPGTEDSRDIAYLQRHVAPAVTATPSAADQPAVASAAPAVRTPVVQQGGPQQPAVQQPAAPQTATPEQPAEDAPLPSLERRDPNAEVPRAGVNSMFGL